MGGSNIKDYYYILGLARDASKDEIKKAYRKLSIKFHPDQNSGDKFFEERFKDINEAYETLVDDENRKIYDERLKESSNSNTNQQSYSYADSSQKYSRGADPASTPSTTTSKNKLKNFLYSIIALIVFSSPAWLKPLIDKLNEKDNSAVNSISTKNTTTDNAVGNDVKLIKIYPNTEPSSSTVAEDPHTDNVNPTSSDEQNNKQPGFKDDDGLLAIDALDNFFDAFTNNECSKAWNMSYNAYWIKQGEDWFCSSQAFGGVRKVAMRSIYFVTQNDLRVEFSVDYYAEDIYNGNKCFKQTIIVEKIVYADNKSRWRVTKMKNNEEPGACNLLEN